MNREKVIKELESLSEWLFHQYQVVYDGDAPNYYDAYKTVDDALAMLKEQEDVLEQMRLDNTDLRNCNAELLEKQKQIKSPDEFKSLLLGMFDSIWDVEIDHPVFQDTVGELMEGVLQAYREAVKWE